MAVFVHTAHALATVALLLPTRSLAYSSSGLPVLAPAFLHDGEVDGGDPPDLAEEEPPSLLRRSALAQARPSLNRRGALELRGSDLARPAVVARADASAAKCAVAQLLQWDGDVFADVEKELKRIGVLEHQNTWDWAVLFTCAVAMFLFDGLVLQPLTRDAGPVVHCLILCIWLSFAGCFSLWVLQRHGRVMYWQWCSGYVLEWLLSMDNLFVFHLIFRAFATPEAFLHKALFWGILGAVCFRLGFFLALNSLLHLHRLFHYVFGCILVYSGVQAFLQDDEEEDPAESRVVICLKKCLGNRLLDRWNPNDNSLFVFTDEKWSATLLVPVILCLEVWDIIFALDSVSAKVAQISNQFMNYSSSVFAMFGLRAMFFIVQDLVKFFELMKYGLCFILVFIGVELLLADYIELPAVAVLVLLLSVFGVCAVGSVIKQRVCPPDAAAAESAAPGPPAQAA